MLSVLLQFSASKDAITLLKESGFKSLANRYIYKEKNKTLIEASFNQDKNNLTLQFPPSCSLEEYTMIHNMIVFLQERLDATLDDSKGLLGYLKEGEGAYIVTNWEKWYEFLQEAKLKTLEGKKVRVLDDTKKELASGLFVGYQKDSNSPYIIECTVITLFGEKTFKGKNLTIEATNEW